MTATLEEMARDAGLTSVISDDCVWFSDDTSADISTDALARFAALVRAQFARTLLAKDSQETEEAINWLLDDEERCEYVGCNTAAQAFCAELLRAQGRERVVRAQARAEALEDAAKCAASLWRIDGQHSADEFAAAIRALKDKP